MRRRLLTLLALFLVVGIPTGCLVRQNRQEQLDHALIDAFKANDIDKVLGALRVGANPNARDYIASSISFHDTLQYLWGQILDRHTRIKSSSPTGLLVFFGERCPSRHSLRGEYRTDEITLLKFPFLFLESHFLFSKRMHFASVRTLAFSRQRFSTSGRDGPVSGNASGPFFVWMLREEGVGEQTANEGVGLLLSPTTVICDIAIGGFP